MNILVDNIDLDGFSGSDLSTAELHLLNEVNSIRTRLGVFGNSPALGILDIHIVLSSDRAIDCYKSSWSGSEKCAYELPRLVDVAELLLLLVTSSTMEIDIQTQSLTRRSLLYGRQ